MLISYEAWLCFYAQTWAIFIYSFLNQIILSCGAYFNYDLKLFGSILLLVSEYEVDQDRFSKVNYYIIKLIHNIENHLRS